MRTTNDYVFFWDGIYSNFYPCKFIMGDIEFETSEQAFMYEKAKYFEDFATAELILKTPYPAEAKKLGRQIKNYDDTKWSKVRENIMMACVYAKFSQIKSLEDQLLSTEDRTLVETSPFDKIWGIGMREWDDGVENPDNWKGENLLGKVLMTVRSMLSHERRLTR